MIILDTNVVSEPLKPRPAQAVVDWLDRQAPQTLYITTINLAELLAGIEALPPGRRRTELHQAFVQQVMPLFNGRILTFDAPAAESFAKINTQAQAADNPISFADAAIAAIASANGFMVATRHVKDFKGTGVAIVDPWGLSKPIAS